MALVTLTTDFGGADTYVGQMKGAILAGDADTRIVDLCHEIPAHDVAAGAWHLETGFAVFPAGTVHLAVVDPGVGTDRPALVAATARYVFVGPDNGVLSRALRRDPPRAVFRLPDVVPAARGASTTFEGRDRFAPVAAGIAAGAPPEQFGVATDSFVRLPVCDAVPRRGVPVEVPVIAVDRFGNVVLDLDAERLRAGPGAAPVPGTALRVTTPAGTVSELRRSYAGGDGSFLVVNSSGYLEIALDRGRADRHHRLQPGSSVVVAVI